MRNLRINHQQNITGEEVEFEELAFNNEPRKSKGVRTITIYSAKKKGQRMNKFQFRTSIVACIRGMILLVKVFVYFIL